MKLVYKLLGAILMTAGLTCEIAAYQPYHALATVPPESTTVSAPNLVDLNHDLSDAALEQLLPIYTPTSAISINFNLRGILALSAFAANSTDLTVVIPQTGDTQIFQGGTRQASLKLFKDYIRDAGNGGKLLRGYAKFSPIDPIAGNPNSLMGQMAQADYLLGILTPTSGCDCSWSAQPSVHQFNTGLNVTRAFSHKFDTTLVQLPLRYTYSPDLSWALILDAPISYFRNGGASSVHSSVGVGLQLPITKNWSLTGIPRGGFGGSLDLCTSGAFFSAGITSNYNIKIANCVLALTDYVGYITSTNLWLTGINFNYHLQNYVFKNGLTLTSCDAFTLCNRAVNFSVAFEDSYFPGHRLYIKHYDEIKFSLIASCINPNLFVDYLSIGFTYQFGEKNYKGYTFNLLYQF